MPRTLKDNLEIPLKFLKMLLKGAGLLFLLLGAGIGYSLWNSHHLDTYFIKGVQFRYDAGTIPLGDRYYDEVANGAPVFQANLHRLKVGNGVILAIRESDLGGHFVIDDESFKKLTIWLPELKAGTFNFKNKEQIRGFYTSGGSAWPDASCSSDIEEGNLEVQDVSASTVKIKIESVIQCKTGLGKLRREVELTEDYKLAELDHKNITPWIGTIGRHIYDETYRRTNAEHREIADESNEIGNQHSANNPTLAAKVLTYSSFPLKESSALRIAETKLIEIYGNRILSQRPFNVSCENDIWTVTGTFHCPENACKGGVAEIKLSAKDGSVVSVTHGK